MPHRRLPVVSIDLQGIRSNDCGLQLRFTMRSEGIIPALESAHAFVAAFKDAPSLSSADAILINQSGRGDKDIFTVAEALGDEGWRKFIRRKAES